MRLSELNPEFKKINGDMSLSSTIDVNEAHCLLMLCPKCFRQNNGEVGTHSLIIYFKDRITPEFNEEKKTILKDMYDSRYKWKVSGGSFENFTVEPSVLLGKGGGCTAHFFITNGEIIEV